MRYREGDCAEVVFDLQTTPADITLAARVSGRYQLPYRQISIELPPGEKRRVSLKGGGVALVLGT